MAGELFTVRGVSENEFWRGYNPNPGPEQMPVGTETGFSTFSGPGERSVQGTPTMSRFFAQEDPHPAFTASTESYRSALDGLARKARNGDAQAAVMHDLFTQRMADRKRLYDIAYSNGLNDQNANDAWQMVLSDSTPGQASSSPWLTDRRVGYLAREALQRGQNVRDLETAQRLMDSSFTSAYLSSLNLAAKNDLRADALAGQIGRDSDAVKLASLRLRESLQGWEKTNGLRSDAMRGAIMKQAGEYFAQAMATPGLNRFVQDVDGLVDAAAAKVGAKAGAQGPNAFENFVNAKGRLTNGFISFCGSADADAAAGYGVTPRGFGREASDGKTAAGKALESVFLDHIGRNVSEGRDAWDFNDPKQLRSDIVTALASVSGGVSVARAGQQVLEDAADEIIKMARDDGHVDLSRLATMYIDPDAKLTPIVSNLPQRTEGVSNFVTAAGELVDQLIGNRPMLARDWANDIKPEFTREGIEASVDARLAKMGLDPKFAKDNRELMRGIRETLVDYIHTTNNFTDPSIAGAENVKEMRAAIGDRMQALFIANDLRRLGVLEGDWTPVNLVDALKAGPFTGHDKTMRGNSPQARKAIWGGLYRAIERWEEKNGWNRRSIDSAISAGEDGDATYANFHAVEGLKQGIRMMLDSGYDSGWWESPSEATARTRAETLAGRVRELLGYSADRGIDFTKTQPFLEAMAVRQAARDNAFNPHTSRWSEDRGKALSLLVNDIFSDRRNPIISRRSGELADKALDAYAPNLSPTARSVWRARFQRQIIDAYGSVTRGKEGTPVEFMDEDGVNDAILRVINPSCLRAKAESDRIEAVRNANLRTKLGIQTDAAVDRKQKLDAS